MSIISYSDKYVDADDLYGWEYYSGGFKQSRYMGCRNNMRALFLGRGLRAAVLYYVNFETGNHHCLHPRPKNPDNGSYKLKSNKREITLELYIIKTKRGKIKVL